MTDTIDNFYWSFTQFHGFLKISEEAVSIAYFYDLSLELFFNFLNSKVF